MLLDLPGDAIGEVLSFLTIADIGCLDSSAASIKHRIHLQMTFKMFIYRNEVIIANEKAISWFDEKGIRLQKVVVKKKIPKTTHGSIINVIKSSPHFTFIESITLQNNLYFTDEQAIAIIEKCTALIDVDFTGCAGIGNNTVNALSTLNLKSLKIGNCRQVHANSVTELVQKLSRSIEVLDISGVINLRNHHVDEMTKHCPQLHTLHLNKCLYITDAAIKSISHNCLALTSLALAYCGKITDASVEHLFNGPLTHRLVSLTLLECMSVTKSSVDFIAKKRCRSLMRLDIRGCLNMTHASVYALKLSQPSIIVVSDC